MNEGGAKPEFASQVTEGCESNENGLSEEKSRSMLEVSFSTGVLWDVSGIPYKTVTENTVFELCVLHNTVLTVVNND